MRYQTAIFDMDGTILETLEDMWASVNVTMDHVGYPRRTMDEVRRFVGNRRGQAHRALYAPPGRIHAIQTH